MKQILHIFWKDARRLWGEIFLSLAITACFVGGTVATLRNGDAPGGSVEVLTLLLAMLVPVGWWILATRVIHAERLVGDTQFWITRPYVWSNLLAAKALFLLAFLYLPFFIAQLVLLAEAGFPPQHYLAGILFNLLLLTGVCVLPLAAIATVTSSFARNTLTLLGILVGFVAITGGGAILFGSQSDGPASHLGEYVCFTIAVVICCAAIVLQYARRRVWVARAVLLALPFVLGAALYLASRYDQARMDRVYSIAQSATPIRFSYVPGTNSSGNAVSTTADPSVPVALDLSATGVAEGDAVIVDAVRADVTAPDGSRWTSQWQALFTAPLGPGEGSVSTQFGMPIEVYNKFRSLPLNVHLVLALTQAHVASVASIPMPMDRFAVPGFGVCAPQTGWTPIPGEVTGIRCVAPVRDPPLTFISTRWSSTPCTGAPSAPDAGVLGTGWTGTLDRWPAQINLSPALDMHVNLSNNQLENGTKDRRALCPGTPITFTQYSRVGRTQASVDVQGFYLPKVVVAGRMITYTTTTTTKPTPAQ